MPSDGWRLAAAVEQSLLTLWQIRRDGSHGIDIAIHLTHLVRVHVDRLVAFAHRIDHKTFKRDFDLVLQPSRGRNRRPDTLAQSVLERLAGRRALNRAAEIGTLNADLVKECLDEIRACPRISHQMREEAAQIWILGGASPPRIWLEGHRAVAPFRLMVSELFNLVVERGGTIELAEYARGRNAGNELVYLPCA